MPRVAPTQAARDGHVVRTRLPQDAVRAHSALGRLVEKAKRFDRALKVLVESDLPEEHREIAERIVKELRG